LLEHDPPLFFDGGWRIAQGQVPYRDFHTALGPLFFMLIAWGMKIGSISTSAINIAIALAAAPAFLLACLSSYRKLPAAYATVFCLVVVFTLFATRFPGWGYWATTYSSYYNRLASAYFYILVIELFPRPPCSQSPEHYALGGMLAGICLGCFSLPKLPTLALRWQCA
jgi:hypothetical protein